MPQEKSPANFSFKLATFDLPPSIPSVSKDSSLGFGKFIGRNPFYLCIKPSIFSSSPFYSFSSSSNPFLVENSYAVGEDVVATRTDVATIAQSDIVIPQTNIKDDNVRTDVVDNVMASINPPSASSSGFFSHHPQPELTSCIGE